MSRQHIQSLPAQLSILVNDYILPARIGLYDFEKLKTQTIKVSAKLLMAPQILGAMGTLETSVDYSKVRDIIKHAAQSQHTEFCETLAAEIISKCLELGGVEMIELTLEKLEIFEDSDVGVHLVVDRRGKSI